MHIIITHEGKQVGHVVTNHSLTTDELLRLAGIDPTEMDGGDPRWDYGKFEFEALSDQEYQERTKADK
jgi:hypothetical protein